MTMVKIRFLFPILTIFLFFSCARKNETKEESKDDVLSYVDPFIGTGGHGHTYPGATTPFGRVQPSPDNGITGWDWCSGYHVSDSIISGFGQLHLSGTGIGDLTDVLLMPTTKTVDVSLFGKGRDTLPYTSKFSHTNETASPGYYQVFLENPEVDVELTANDYVAYHQYTYKNKEKESSFILDLGYEVNWDKATASGVTIENDTLVSGYRFSKGWAKNQKVFFAIETSNPITGNSLVADGQIAENTNKVEGTKTGGQFFFGTHTKAVGLKIAVSSVSIENAKKNLKSYGSQNFDAVRLETENTWKGLLDRIRIETPVDSLKTIFYTSFYHTQVAPTLFSDSNGEFRLQNDSIAKAEGFDMYSTLSLWDIFRAETPLLSVLDPERINAMVRSMLAYYDQSGVLPVWVLSGNETGTMPGYHSVSIIAEAYLKGIRDYDTEKAFEAMKKTMTGDERGLGPYQEFGYIPYDIMDQSVSISLELAYNDWCLGQVAKEMGKQEDYEYFTKRSKAFQNFYDPNSGFLRGKSSDGTAFHEPFDPKVSNHIEDTDYTEGNAWQHSWYVLHDVGGLIELHGGGEPFSKMVEQLFTESSELKGDNISADISGLIGQYAHGNEPSHHIAYMFNKAGQPWRTQYWSREILNSQYTTQPDGLSGNEDCGQMSAWYVMSAIGIYPMNPASLEYEIGSPLFKKSTIKLPNDKTFVISAPNTSKENLYVQSVKLNGESLNRTYIRHEEIVSGGTLDFEMGPRPNTLWGVGDE
ncbi:GH92 family glycosyl hydrolase [Ulvibacterium sp.]|uniref:GH92 family glycosyl hydrolase n=1 Tax=Ulvibacterium sp. TaxID=2665914 RepID=UPI002605A24D|nr:GH92 family glycosyl hydrolase [Ulvibacterium sp.]